MTRRPLLPLLFLTLLFTSCTQQKPADKSGDAKTGSQPTPVVGFVQAVEDETINEAKKGFYDALAKSGFSEEKGTVKIVYRNAQNDQAVLNQILDQFIADKVTLIAANTTLAMITAVQKTKEIPIFMMVSPSPDINRLTEIVGSNEKAPKNLSGVYETLRYIDSSMTVIHSVFPNAKKIGVVFNSSEINSLNSVKKLREKCKELGITVEEQAISSSNESQQATLALLDKKIDLFFALPDNLVFASFETIVKATSEKKIPIVTSEEGLVKRGAFMAFGADFYQWGYQAGESAAAYLKDGDLVAVPLRTVSIRKLVHNDSVAKVLGIAPPQGSVAVK